MKKKKLGPDAKLYPMPAVLAGGRGDGGKVSFATLAWAGIVNSTPPMVGVAIRKSRYTHKLISETKSFSVNVPSAKQAVETDFCGIRSGRDHDKAAVCGFTVFYGENADAPLIEECPVNLECTVEQVVELPSHDLFIGRITETHVNDGDIDPLVFMGTHYAKVTGNLGKAFSCGTKLDPKKK